MRDMKDSDVIDEFVAYLKKNGHPDLKVDRHPDIENRDSPDIDAIAGPFAIEHTRIDSLPNQSRNNDWFIQVVGGLEQELSAQLSFYLAVALEYTAITTGQTWIAIKQTLRSWIVKESPHLEDGHHVLNNVPGIPFTLHVDKDMNLPGGLYFSRRTPNDSTFPNCIRKQLDRKTKKLANYQGCEKTTVLLVESNDIALMHPSIMLNALQKAYTNGLPPGVDKIWYADTSVDGRITFTDFTPNLMKK